MFVDTSKMQKMYQSYTLCNKLVNDSLILTMLLNVWLDVHNLIT